MRMNLLGVVNIIQVYKYNTSQNQTLETTDVWHLLFTRLKKERKRMSPQFGSIKIRFVHLKLQPLGCLPETITTLLIGYTPIPSKKIKKIRFEC